MNYVCLIGHVGQDPAIKTFENSGQLATFSLATVERWKNKQGEKQEKTDWHNIVCNGKVVEVVEKYVKKGTHLNITGKIRTRSWDDKDGVKHYTTEIIMENMEFLGSKQAGTENEKPLTQEEINNNGDGFIDSLNKENGKTDDLPF